MFHVSSWVLYEKPDFQGRTIALEEGAIELNNVWAEDGVDTEPRDSSPMLIGSIRLAVWVNKKNAITVMKRVPNVLKTEEGKESHLLLCRGIGGRSAGRSW